MTEPPARIELPRLTALRAFAALAVFGYHVGKEAGWRPAHVFLADGFTGVAFFFVLSGFVLAWSTSPGGSVSAFYRRRFARIWPMHAVMTGVALLLPAAAVDPGGVRAVFALLLVQSWSPHWQIIYAGNGVSWSLSCEMAFYAMLPFLLPLVRQMSTARRWLLAGGWWAVVSVVTLAAAHHEGTAALVVYVNPLIRSGEFVLGVTAAVQLAEGSLRFSMPKALGVLAVLAIVSRGLSLPQPASDVLLVPGYFALIVAAATVDVTGAGGWLTNRWLIYAGQVSFAFYLVHEMVLQNTMHFLPGASPVVAGGVALIVAAALSVAAHHLIERPCQRILSPRRRVAPPPQKLELEPA